MRRTFKEWVKAAGLMPKSRPSAEGRKILATMYLAAEFPEGEMPSEDDKKKAEGDADKLECEDDPELDEDGNPKKKDDDAVIARFGNKILAQLKLANDIEQATKEFPDIRAEALNDDGSIKAGWGLARIKERVALEQVRASREGPLLIVNTPSPETTIQALQGAILLRCGGQLDSKHYGTHAGVAMGLPGWIRAGLNTDQRQRAMETAHRFSSYSMFDICRLVCSLGGAPSHGSKEDVIRAAASVNLGETIRAANSGGTLTNIFTTSMNAILIQTYMEAPSTIGAWTKPVDVKDFKSHDEIRLQKDGAAMRVLPRGGTAGMSKRQDEVESYFVKRFAEQASVDEQDVIDDNLGAIKDFPVEMGLKASRLPQDLGYAVLLANPTLGATGRALFHDSNSPDNLRASSAFTADNLKAAISAMQLATENGVNLNLVATHIIAPPSLKYAILQQLNSSAVIIAGTAGSVTERGDANVLQNAVTPIIDARLENGVTVSTGPKPEDDVTYSGSSTDWFLASTNVRTVAIIYREGTGRAPQTQNWQQSQGQWGMGWAVNFDIGAAAMDHLGLQKNSA